MLTGQTPFPGSDPFVIMNDRLVKDPVPPCDIDPSITPELQETLFRALERNPKSRYSSAREFANDLLHPDRIRVAHRVSSGDQLRPQATKTALLFGVLATDFIDNLDPYSIFHPFLLPTMIHR